MNWDPITRIVGSLGIYTKIDFGKSQGGRVLQHVVDFSRLQHLHEGQGPARRAFHHQPHLRNLRRQSRDLLLLRAEHGLSASSRRISPNGSSTLAKRPSTCSITTCSRTIWSAWISASGWCARPIPACGEKAEKAEAPHADVHGYRTIADIMRRSIRSRASSIAKPADQPLDARDVLPDGRAPRASVDALSRRRRHGADRAAVHRLPDAADAVRRFPEEASCRCTTTVQFFLRGDAGLRRSRRRRILLGCWGSFQDPDVCDYQLPRHDRMGPQDVRHARHRGRRQLVTTDLVEINLGIRILLGQFVLRRLGQAAKCS